MAFDALATIMTDKKINTLLCYGDDYEIIDNQIKPNGYYNTYMVENKMISYPFYQYESANTQSHFKKVINNADLSKNIGFYFDGKKVSNQLVKMENIINKLNKEFPSSEYKTGEEYLKELNKKLYDAGLQDVIDEANRQLDEFYKDKTSN